MNNIHFYFLLSSVLLSIFFLINLKNFALHLNLIDNAINKIHQIDTPKFGFFLSIIILINILFLFFFFEISYNHICITIYIFIFSVIGYLDDRYDLSVKKRFLF